MNKQTGQRGSQSDREIVSSRVFNAGREKVFAAWAEAGHLKNWWGPKGFTNTFNEFDFREGGKWRFVMHGPEKGNYVNEVEFLQIRKPEFICWNRISKPLFRIQATFEEMPGNKTLLVFRMLFASAEECNKIKPFAPEKNEENFDRLEQELLSM